MVAKRSEWIVEVVFRGDFDGWVAARAVGVTPFEAWLAGDPVLAGAPITHKSGGFSVRSRREATASLMEHIADVIGQIDAPTVRLSRLKPAPSEVEMSCVLFFAGNGSPEVWIDTSALMFMSRIGANLAFDIYHGSNGQAHADESDNSAH